MRQNPSEISQMGFTLSSLLTLNRCRAHGIKEAVHIMNSQLLIICRIDVMRARIRSHSLVHGKAVQRHAAGSHIRISELCPADIAVDAAEDAESLPFVVLKLLIVWRIAARRTDVRGRLYARQ